MQTVEPQAQLAGRKRRVGARPRIVLIVVALVVVAFGLLPSPYAVQQPGPVLNTLGDAEIDGEVRPVIKISGAETTGADGVLNMLTVRILGHPDSPISFFEVLPNLFRPGVEIVRLDQVYPRGQTIEERDEANQMLMDNSQEIAAVAALRALDREVSGTVTIVDVMDDGAASGVIAPGDVLVSVAGIPAEGSAQVRQVVGESVAGLPLDMTVLRDGARLDLEVTPTWSEVGQRSLIGVTLVAEYDMEVEVDIALERTGGPSAGMVFALAIMQQLTSDDLIGDLVVSGTGTVDDDGSVGAVGGVSSKLQAAHDVGSDLFLMPVANCQHLPDRIPSGITVAPVSNLSEALDVITRTRTGDDVPWIERCDGASFSTAL